MLMTDGHFSTLASQSCQCFTDDLIWGIQDDQASTKACCDAWEDAGSEGVKYSGTWDDVVRAIWIHKVRNIVENFYQCEDPNNVIDTKSWNDCCTWEGVEFGSC
jgi:hypothetical protein